MEGPSLVILKEELAEFVGNRIKGVGGNTLKIEKQRLKNKVIRGIHTWGKHLIFEFDKFFVRIHFLMYGSYRINERKPGKKARLCFKTKSGELNFYNCSVILVDEPLNESYDWKADLMGDEWDEELAIKRVKQNPEEQVCDVLLDQDIFAGLGNIMKCETLYNVRIHPETKVKALSEKEIKELVSESRAYAFEFYGWKRIFELRKHWKIYKQKVCSSCGGKVTLKKTGKKNRRSFICESCQKKK